MNKLLWMLTGAIVFWVVAAIAGLVFLKTAANGFSARAQPSPVERWAARKARSLAVPADAKSLANPEPDSPDVLAEARAHWADHCAGCHSNNGSGDAEMGKNMYPHAPDMRKSGTQDLSDGELFYVIQNGVRLTGMPGWGSGSGHDASDSWKLVRFIRHLPKLTAEEEEEMETLNPKTPDELKEEQEEKDFLNGGQPNEEQHEHHHH